MGTNTGIGIGIGIPFKNNALGGDRPYLPPELKARLIGVWDNYGKKNTDADRNIIKNKIPNAGGDLEILNAAYKLNSGFGKYKEDFTTWVGAAISINNGAGFKIERNNTGWWGFSTYGVKATNEFKIKVTNCRDAFSWRYKDAEGIWQTMNITKDGIYTLPASQEKDEHDAPRFFNGNPNATYNGLTVEQIPSYQGAFVTDGVNDLITSTKTVQEMGITDEITVVSMIHKISSDNNWTNLIGELKGDHTFVANRGINTDKTGIYGYTYNYNENAIVINNILGDKNDYIVKTSTSLGLDNKYYVTGFRSAGIIQNISQVAWYWTIIANKVLTTDEINQVIAYFNLDRTLKPDILCNTIKQGITNENHAEFGDKLIDFSGNGRDIQLNNLAWKGDSGIGKYEVDFLDSSIWNSSNSTITSSKIDCKNAISHIMLLYYSVGSKEYPDIPSFKVIKTGADIDYSYINETGSPKSVRIVDGVNILPASHNTLYSGSGRFCGFGNPGMGNSVTITQIPSHAGGLCLDGVNDFGKVTGMPIYKDYTVVADYERFYLEPITGGRASILSKSSKVGDGSFIFNLEDQGGGKACYTFGGANGNISDDITRIIRYQSKYYNTKTLSIGTAEDNDFMVLGKVREVDSRHFYGVIYSLMTFPYSMSEFLIERQLKKHKLGTLYPDMVEFRPVIKSNVLLDAKPTFVIRGTSTYLNAGDYVPENSQIWVSIKMNNIADRITKFTVNGKTIDIPENAYSEVTLQYGFPFVIDKSPQKISITIEQDENYVKFEPVITSNVEYVRLDFYLNNYQKRINIGDYIPKDAYLRANFYLKNNVDELTVFTFNGVNIGYRRSSVDDTAFNIGQIYNYDSPQEVNITIDEYIRFEDIVQPYPLFFEFTDENGNLISWGGKAKVGNTIIRTKSVSNANILAGLYNSSSYKLNGKPLERNSYVVEKQMVFTCTTTYLLDNNEPKCILSPSRLRIPNSSYKLLGYIPDISGHGNHGAIHNSAYAEGSGVNEDGSYQFDGVDDFVTIPTTVGGKQVLMKVNWQKEDTMIYNQNPGEDNFAIFANDYNNNNLVNAYASRNNGSTYIDGILNNNILATQLKDVTHNITITNENVVNNTIVPVIGANAAHNNFYAQMALYDFMLFDEISTDDKIKELNEYVGIEAKPKQGLLQPSITVNGSYVVLDTVEDTNDYLVNGTADCGIGFSDESASKQFSTGVTYDKNFSYSIIVIANNNKELISLSHNGVSADSIQSMDYSETTKLYICSTTNGMFAVGSAPQEIIIELSD